MKKLSVVNISKDPFWKLPKHMSQALIERYSNKFDIHFIDETSGMRESLKDSHFVVGMPFSKSALKKNQVLERVHFWTAQVPLSWQDPANIRVSNSIGVNSDSVSEHGLFLCLKALRGEVSNKEFRKDGFAIAQSPKNLSCGIMGFGNIGELLLKSVSPLFGKKNILSRSKKSNNNIDNFFLSEQLGEFSKLNDYIFLTLPLTEKTRHSLDRESFFSHLKKNVTIINLSRAEVFKEDDLIEFFKDNVSARYLTDVTTPEPYPENGVLREMDNVFMTPHIAGRRDDIWELLFERTIQEMDKWISNE